MRVTDEKARTFYAEESVEAGWRVRQLQRQSNTLFYQRILSSRDKENVAAENYNHRFKRWYKNGPKRAAYWPA